MGLSKMIIRPAGIYASNFFSAIPKPVIEVEKYFNLIKPIHSILLNNFPFLNMVILPTKQPCTAFIQGLLLPVYAIREMDLLPDQYNDFGLPIFANIPEDFQTKGLEVYDSRRRIDWKQVPYEIMHCHYPTKEEEVYDQRKICTHKAEDISAENCVLNVLLSAYYLFQEYNRYDSIKKFELECHPHEDGSKSRGERHWRKKN